MKSTSPPAPVTASPVATPGVDVRSAVSGVNFGRPRYLTRASASTWIGASVHRSRSATGDLPQDLSEAPLQLPHARLAGVLGGDHAERHVGEVDVGGLQPRLLDLPRQQVVARDGDLLRLGVAVERHDLHAVSQRAGDGVEDVRGGEEEHVGQVEVDLEVVVAERVVLRRVEHLEQGGRRVAPEVGCRPCRSRRAARPGSSSPPRGSPGRCGRAARRRRCAGGRGSPPRREHRRARPARSCGPAPAPRTRRATSCRRRAGRPARGRRRSPGRRPSPCPSARGATAPRGTRSGAP